MDYFATLQRWLEVRQTLAIAKAEEQQLRETLFTLTFTAPKEGVNTHLFSDGSVLRGTYVINRTLIKDNFAERYAKLKLPEEKKAAVIVPEPKFVLSAYRELTDKEQRAFDHILTIKPGLPKLEFVPKKGT